MVHFLFHSLQKPLLDAGGGVMVGSMIQVSRGDISCFSASAALTEFTAWRGRHPSEDSCPVHEPGLLWCQMCNVNVDSIILWWRTLIGCSIPLVITGYMWYNSSGFHAASQPDFFMNPSIHIHPIKKLLLESRIYRTPEAPMDFMEDFPFVNHFSRELSVKSIS